MRNKPNYEKTKEELREENARLWDKILELQAEVRSWKRKERHARRLLVRNNAVLNRIVEEHKAQMKNLHAYARTRGRVAADADP